MKEKQKKTMTIKEICQQIRMGLLTFDGGIDVMMNSDAEPLGRIDYSDLLWNNMGRPTDEQLQAWERQGQVAETAQSGSDNTSKEDPIG